MKSLADAHARKFIAITRNREAVEERRLRQRAEAVARRAEKTASRSPPSTVTTATARILPVHVRPRSREEDVSGGCDDARWQECVVTSSEVDATARFDLTLTDPGVDPVIQPPPRHSHSNRKTTA